MFCKNCGSKFGENNKFCTVCGDERNGTSNYIPMGIAEAKKPNTKNLKIALAVIAVVLLTSGGVFFVLHDSTGLVGEWERRLESAVYLSYDEMVMILRFNRNNSGTMTTISRRFRYPERISESSYDFTWEISGDNQILHTFRREDGTFYESGLWDFTVAGNVLVIGEAVYTRR